MKRTTSSASDGTSVVDDSPEAVISSDESIVLSSEDFDRVTALIEGASEPTPAMVELFKEPSS